MRIAFVEFTAVITLAAVPCFGQGIINTVAGASKCCNSADGGLAVATWLPAASGITVDRLGNLYIWDGSSSRVRKVNTSGVITTVAGNGSAGYSGDGGPAISAQLFANGSVSGLAVDPAGNLYISDGNNHVVRKVNTSGIISTIAGNRSSGFSGDGGQATSAQLYYPAGIALDSEGNLYIADSSNSRVRKVNAAGVISTYAGNGNVAYSGDNVQATTTSVHRPEGVTVDGAGNLYISETSDSRVRKVDPSGVITTVAGQTKKTNGFSGDGGPATAATMAGPIGLAVDQSGSLYIADSSNARVRKVDAAGIITTVAGISGNSSTPIGDGGPATSAYLGNTKDVALDSAGNLYIAGSAGGVQRVRKVTASVGLSADPSSLSFSFAVGGATPASQSVNVTSSGAALSFTATASTTSGSNWLAVSPAAGTTSTKLTVSVNPAGLAGGVYQGAITLTATGAAAQSFAVTLTVTGAGAPSFTSGGVVNALGYQAKLAPDTVFVVFGNGLGPAILAAATSSDYPTAIGGTSITFTPLAGGTAINARMVYSVAGQVAGLLPSSIAPGVYAVRVIYNGITSAPQNVTVVARSFGIATSNSAGTGTAQATIGNVNAGLSLTRFTSGSVAFGGHTWTLSPAHPGDTLVLWGTGGGADPANDTGGTSGDQTKAGNFLVTVGSRQITPVYAGASSGYPGLWQINFVLPTDISPDCFASAQVSAGGELSNAVTIPIATAGQNACTDSQLSQSALAKFDAGGDITVATFGMAKLTATDAGVTNESGSGSVTRFTATEWALAQGIKVAGCSVYDRTYPAGGKDPATPDVFLDAGARLPLAGPGLAGAGLASTGTPTGPVYLFLPPAGTLKEGKYTLTGNGGTQVGAFTASTDFPSSFSVTNWDAVTTVNRSQPLTFNWTGSGFDKVFMLVNTSIRAGSNLHITTISCYAPASAGTFSVPTAALAYLQPAPASGASFGSISVQAVSVPGTFTATLASGGTTDIGVFGANEGVAKNVAVQ